MFEVIVGDCRETLRGMPEASVDAVVTDPPYELGFMGKSWDASGVAFDPATWREVLRVLKPGGHLLAFSGSRTYHRMACAIEDAGFQVRDQIMWIYGSGFPKSLDVSKAIDATQITGASHSRNIKQANMIRPGESRETATLPNNGMMSGERRGGATNNNPATDDAKRWQGWGTALKPAHEPICMARKPLDGTVAANVLRHGTGAMNIDACRVPFVSEEDERESKTKNQHADFGTPPVTGNTVYGDFSMLTPKNYNPPGRWPANLMHDGSDEATAGMADAARYFYCAKASRADREAGCDGLPERTGAEAVDREADSAGMASPRAGAGRTASSVRNHHPTVKPTELMRYLVRLVTPPGGLVLDPFTGSGSTGRGAVLEGFRFVGCELSPEYAEIARARIADAARTPGLFR